MADLTETLYGLIDEPSDQLWGQDFQQITEAEHQQNLQPYYEEEARLQREGFLPPKDTGQSSDKVKVYGDNQGTTLENLRKKWNEESSKGSGILYTNVPEAGAEAEAQGKEVRYYGGSSASEEQKEPTQGLDPNVFDPNSAFVQALKQQVSSLAESAADPIAYAEKRAQIAASMAAKEADFQQQAQAQAMARYAVSDYEKLVSIVKQREQSNPEFRATFGTADGPDTLAAKQKLAQAWNQANGAVPEILASNGNYKALRAYAETYVGTEEARVRKEIATQEGLDAKAEELLFGLDTAQRENLVKLTGSTDIRAQAAFIRAQKGKDYQALQYALAGGNENLPVQALTGNRFAKDLVSKQEATVFGAEAGSRVNELESITQNDRAAEVALATMKNSGYFSEDQMKAWEQRKALATAGLHGTKEDQGEAAAMRLDIAANYAKFKTQQEFLGDVLSLQNRAKVPAPSWVVQEAEASGTVTKQKALDLIAQAGTPEEKRARAEELLNYYTSAVQTQNNSSLFKVDARLIPQLRDEAALVVAGANWKTNESIAGKIYRGISQNYQDFKKFGSAVTDDLSGAALFAPNYLAELLGNEDPSVESALQKGRIFGTSLDSGMAGPYIKKGGN